MKLMIPSGIEVLLAPQILDNVLSLQAVREGGMREKGLGKEDTHNCCLPVVPQTRQHTGSKLLV